MRTLLTGGILAGMALGAAGGVRMDYYRGVYSRDPAEVKALFDQRVRPDWTGVCKTSWTVSPWRSSEDPKLGHQNGPMERCAGAVMRGWLVPKIDGDYSLITILRTTGMRLFLSPDASFEHLKEVPLVQGKLFGDMKVEQKKHGKAGEMAHNNYPAAYNPKPIPLKKGRKYAFRLFGTAGDECEVVRFEWAYAYDSKDKDKDLDDDEALETEDDDLGMSMNRKMTAVREAIPDKCLIPEDEGEWAPDMEFAVTPVSPEGDEPDELSRENLSVNLTAMRDYLAFARDAKASVTPAPARTVPYARLPGGPKTNLSFTVKEEGDYRVWLRYKYRKGYNVYLHLRAYPEGDANVTAFTQLYGRGRECFSKADVGDWPVPLVKDVLEDSETGYRWEASYKMVHLKPGTYRTEVDTGWYTPLRCSTDVNGIVLDGDPMREPGEKDVIKKPEYGTHELSDDARAHAALLGDAALFERWRTAFLKRLEAPHYGEYDIGYLASRVVFDPDLNAVGKPCELRALKRSDAMGFHGGAGVDANKVGDGPIGFWRCADPWGIVHRFTPPAASSRNFSPKKEKLTPFGKRNWVFEPLDARELNRAEYAMDVMSGEVRSELLLIRNNTDKPIVIAPVVKGDVKAGCRVVTYALSGTGFWTPKMLFTRKEVVLTPHANTGLWLTIDCRGAKEGAHAVSLAFADKTVTWNLAVKGALDEKKPIYVSGWCRPLYRESCWEAFRDIGINVMKPCLDCDKAKMKKYGIEFFATLHWEQTEESLRAAVATARKRGLEPGDYVFGCGDEASDPEEIKRIGERCELVRKAGCRSWVNGGSAPTEENCEEVFRKFLDNVDVFCPFWMQLQGRMTNDTLSARAYNSAGKCRIVYSTPSYPDNDDQVDVSDAYIWLSEFAREHGRDGFAPHNFRSYGPEEDAYLLHGIATYLPGDHGKTILTRNIEALREGVRRWRVKDAREKLFSPQE